MNTGANELRTEQRVMTLLLTDVEGSSALWERLANVMPAVLDDLDSIIHEAVERRSGRVIKSKGEGDSSFSVFANTVDALDAAVDIQRTLRAQIWPGDLQLRVRMGINTGPVVERGGDLFGQAVNRAGRLRAVGHGGQILLTEEVVESVRGELPQDMAVKDLGMRRLKGLTRPQRILQLAHPDLPDSFPPITAADARPNNLPAPPNEFVGRVSEMASIKGLLRGNARLLTLTGPGGVGKTRLALQVASDLIDEFEDGVWLAMLSETRDPDLVPEVIARSLQVKEAPGASATQALIAELQKKHALLVIDNFEQVQDAATFLAELLSSCPRLKVIVTSRTWLNLQAEHPVEIKPLPVPDRPDSLEEDQAREFDSIVLFEQRAAAAKPGSLLGKQELPLVARVCCRLEGLPLALELAAAQMRTKQLPEIVEELERRLQVLIEGPVDLPRRQRTLRAAIDWSYDLLSEDQRALLARLSVFAGSFTEDQALSLSGGTEEDVSRLVAHHLVTKEETIEGPRLRLLETVREYADEQLRSRGEHHEYHHRHLLLMIELAEEISQMALGPDATKAHRLFTLTMPDIEAALDYGTRHHKEKAAVLGVKTYKMSVAMGAASQAKRWMELLLEHPEAITPSTRLSAYHAFGWLCLITGDPVRGKEILEDALKLEEHGSLADRAALRAGLAAARLSLGDIDGARAICEETLAEIAEEEILPSNLSTIHNVLGIAASMRSDFQEAQDHWEKCLATVRSIGDMSSSSAVLTNLGGLAFNRGDVRLSYERYSESIEVLRQIGNKPVLATALTGLGQAAIELGRLDESEKVLREAADIRREMGDVPGLGYSLLILAKTRQLQGDHDEAAALTKEGEEIAAQVANPQVKANVLHTLGELALRRGQVDEARGLIAEALQLHSSLNDRRLMVICLELLAECLARKGEGRNAQVLLSSADILRAQVPAPRVPTEESAVASTRRLIAESLTGEDLERACREGAALDLNDAVRTALEMASPRAASG